MKVAVITRHAVFNYGSLLQTLATQQIINKLGHESVIIDYRREDEDYKKIAGTLLQNVPRWNSSFVRRTIYKLTQSPKFYIMGRHFEKLRKGTFPTTVRYKSEDELRKNKPQADVYMTGSDQVWGPIGKDTFDPAFFLSFTDDDDKRVSYAASFGKTAFTDEILEQFCALLQRYDAITVRERSAVEIISDMNIPNIRQVLDPTLLIPGTQWSELIKDQFPEKYILVYQLHNNADMLEYAYTLSRKTGLPLVTMSSTSQHLSHKGSKHVFLPDLSQWLGYIKNASFMLTDSFHGTAFAINFGTQFVNVLPKGTATRNQSILELTGLSRRVVTNYEDFSWLDDTIDYEKVHGIIAGEREKSIRILEDILK